MWLIVTESILLIAVQFMECVDLRHPKYRLGVIIVSPQILSWIIKIEIVFKNANQLCGHCINDVIHYLQVVDIRANRMSLP